MHRIVRLVVFIILASYVHNGTAQVEGIGKFDISKVREAAIADDSGGGSLPEKTVERENVFSVIARIMFYLGVVVILIVIIALFFKKKARQGSRGAGGAMDVIESLSIGANRMLVMVRVMDEIYLLSQTATAVVLIDKIGGQKALDMIASSKGGGTMIHFKDALNSFMGKMKKNV